MADVVRVLGVWEQIWLVAGLRWRILRNNLHKKNNRLDLIALIVASVFGALFVLGVSAAFFFGGYEFASDGHEAWFALLFWGIFIFWQAFPIFVAGFGAGFEFRKLLRFPLSLRAFYIISLAYGFSDFGAIASICWLVAMMIGAVMVQPALLPALLIICGLFVWMNVTLERTIGSWLERILARRRAREFFFVLFIFLVVSVQFISPVLQRYGSSARPWVRQLIPYLSVFPPSLGGQAIAAAARHNLNAALLGWLGVVAYFALFSVLLWLRLAAQYRGEELGETAAPASAVRRAAQVNNKPDALSLLTPQAAAVVRKEFHYLTRNSFAFFLLIMPPAFVLLFTTQFASRHPTALKHPIPTETFFPGMMAYLLLILMSPAYNGFAHEGKGMQTYFTSPMTFRDVFIGKNIVHAVVVVLELLISVAAFSYFVALPSFPVLAATAAAIVFVVIGQFTIANWSSLSFPRKLNFGQMRGQRQSGMAALVGLGTQLLMGAIGAPILLMGRWAGNAWLPAEVFACLAVAAILGYSSALDPLARLAEKKKESLIDALSR